VHAEPAGGIWDLNLRALHNRARVFLQYYFLPQIEHTSGPRTYAMLTQQASHACASQSSHVVGAARNARKCMWSSL